MGLGLGSGLSPLAIRTRSFKATTLHTAILTQAVAASQATLITIPRAVTERVGVTYGVFPVHAHNTVMTQGVGVTDPRTALWGIQLLERLGVLHSQVSNQKSYQLLSQTMRTRDALQQGRPVVLTQGMGIARTLKATAGLQIIEKLGLKDVMGPMLKYGLTMAERVAIADRFFRFIGVSLTQGMAISRVLLGSAHRFATLSQGVGVAPLIAPRLIFKVTTTQGVGIDDINVLKLVFSPKLVDGIKITAAYLAPSGSFTTWAMNTRTRGVTEYSNYAFNSFARIGNKYIGASSTGLYELLGDDDDGTDIVARIKSGFAQWAGTRFTLFKAIYLGVRGEGSFVLRLISGDGKTYDYAVSTRDMRSTKVHMGKGLRARYFAFELISTGQDFDLESIEFVPLVTQRRV